MSADEYTKEYARFMAARQLYATLFNKAYMGPIGPSLSGSLTSLLETIAIEYFESKFSFQFNEPGSHAPLQVGKTILHYSQPMYTADLTGAEVDVLTNELFTEYDFKIFDPKIIPKMRENMARRMLKYSGPEANFEENIWRITTETGRYELSTIPPFQTEEYIVCLYACNQRTDPEGQMHRDAYLYYLGYYCDINLIPFGLHSPLTTPDDPTAGQDNAESKDTSP